MIITATIVSKAGTIFHSEQTLPHILRGDISKHANNFIFSLSIETEDIEFPYIETTKLRYIYKETGDLYWLVVTKIESEMYSDIHLLGKFVCAIMEYGPTELNSSTLTDNQKEMFYRHIWRPWDGMESRCQLCNLIGSLTPQAWEREFDTRLDFLVRIRDGHVDDDDMVYFNSLISEAWSIGVKLNPAWSHLNGHNREIGNESCSSSEDEMISEETVIDNCRLKCRLEDIRLEVSRLQDPYLKLFARRDLMNEIVLVDHDATAICDSINEISSANSD